MNKNVVFPHNFNPNQGFPVEVLNKIYNVCDAVVSSTLGEGTGLAQLEAMACGTPVISPDNTACTEIIGEDRGLLVDSGADIEHHMLLPHDNEVLRPTISIEDMVAKMEQMYLSETLRFKLGENGYKWVTENLVWENNIVPQWEKIFDEAVRNLDEDEEDEMVYGGGLEI